MFSSTHWLTTWTWFPKPYGTVLWSCRAFRRQGLAAGYRPQRWADDGYRLLMFLLTSYFPTSYIMKSLRYKQMLARSFLRPCHQERWKCLKPIIKLCPPSRRGLSGLSSQGWKSNYLSIIWYLFGPMSRRISSTHRIALEHWALVKL